MAKLVLNSGTSQACEFHLQPGSNHIGRGFANDFKIEDPSVSTSHCEIVVRDEGVVVKDKGSTNGTFIDLAPVKEGGLSPGQTLKLGSVEMLFHHDSPAQMPAPASARATARVRVPSPAQPVPAAAPAVSGLRVTGLAPAAPIVAPPPSVATPPVPPVTAPVAQAPAGKTACKFHPKTGGEWLCQKCNELFCSLCVSARPGGSEAGHYCRRCGSQCLPVKVTFIPSKEKNQVKNYSDGVILIRSIGFGFGAAMLAAIFWTAFAWFTGFEVPSLFCLGTGVLCGYAVQWGCQDRPGVVFSLMAVGFALLGIVTGKIGATLVEHMFFIGGLIYLCLGMVGAVFLAWKFGGGGFLTGSASNHAKAVA